MNYSTLLNRSIDYDPYAAIGNPNYPDELYRQLQLALTQMLWDRGEANGYAHHLTNDPLPGTPRHEVLLIEAFGDHQVANIATETEARTAGIPVHKPALGPGRSTHVDPLWDIRAVPSDPHRGSALVMWDYGSARTARRQPAASNRPRTHTARAASETARRLPGSGVPLRARLLRRCVRRQAVHVRRVAVMP